MEKVAEQGQELMGQVGYLSEFADNVNESSKNVDKQR